MDLKCFKYAMFKPGTLCCSMDSHPTGLYIYRFHPIVSRFQVVCYIVYKVLYIKGWLPRFQPSKVQPLAIFHVEA